MEREKTNALILLKEYEQNIIVTEDEMSKLEKTQIYKGKFEISNVFQSLINEMQIEYVRKKLPLDFVRKMGKSKKEVILNKVYIAKKC